MRACCVSPRWGRGYVCDLLVVGDWWGESDKEVRLFGEEDLINVGDYKHAGFGRFVDSPAGRSGTAFAVDAAVRKPKGRMKEMGGEARKGGGTH